MGVCDSKSSESRDVPLTPSGAQPVLWGGVAENTSKITREYRIWMESIGSGSCGEVRKALHVATGTLRAIKIVYKFQGELTEPGKLFREVEILQKTDHPNIIKVFEYFQDAKFLYIVMELAGGGELFSRIQSMKRFSESQAAALFFQLASTLNYLHFHNIVHRDIKPENLLLDEGDNLKLVDFGAAKIFKPGHAMHRFYGSPYYVAPEVLEGNYDEKCDIWSAGVVLFILLTGILPFSGATDEEVHKAVRTAKINLEAPQFDGISPLAKDLLNRMLTRSPKARPSAAEVLSHPWLRQSEPSDHGINPSTLANLSRFETKSQLTRAIYFFMVTHCISMEEKKALTELFNRLDTNNDGVLSKDELVSGFRSADFPLLTLSELDHLISRLDQNNSSEIDYTEFIAAATDRKAVISREKIKRVFQIFDRDGNGKISPSEFRDAFKGAKEARWVELVAEIDKDGNGEIDYQEFEDILLKLAEN